jgi:hypothetical protein
MAYADEMDVSTLRMIASIRLSRMVRTLALVDVVRQPAQTALVRQRPAAVGTSPSDHSPQELQWWKHEHSGLHEWYDCVCR